jgi:hypothetical protein
MCSFGRFEELYSFFHISENTQPVTASLIAGEPHRHLNDHKIYKSLSVNEEESPDFPHSSSVLLADKIMSSLYIQDGQNAEFVLTAGCTCAVPLLKIYQSTCRRRRL